MRRFATIGLSMAALLGLSVAWAQDEKKQDEPKTEAKAEAPAEKPIPPEVQAKLEAARKAVAEAIVAAQDAGLVASSIDPPPILDILLTGRANDEAAVKDKKGVSPEVFGAWFTGYGRAIPGITYEKDVRIVQPSKGLKDFYDQRAAMLRSQIEAVRKAQGPAPAAAKPEEKKDEPKPEAKPEEKKDEPKPEAKKADEPKQDDK